MGLTWAEFEKVDMRVGVVVDAQEFPEARRPAYKLWVDFGPLGIKPRVVVECDSSSSLITEIETGRGVAIGSPILRHASGKRLLYRPLTGTTEVLSVGLARATKGDVTPAGEKFCEILRKISNGANAAKPKPRKFL